MAGDLPLKAGVPAINMSENRQTWQTEQAERITEKEMDGMNDSLKETEKNKSARCGGASLWLKDEAEADRAGTHCSDE